jgi:hypothetical protein
MQIIKLAVLAISAFLLGGLVERVHSDQTACRATAPYCLGQSIRRAVVGAPSPPPVAINRFEQYRPAPVVVVDDQLARINADLARDRQVEEDAKVQAKAIADELERR